MRNSPDGRLMSVMMRVILTIFDMAALFTDPAFYGLGVSRGDGKACRAETRTAWHDFYIAPLHGRLCWRAISLSPLTLISTLTAFSDSARRFWRKLRSAWRVTTIVA